MNKDDELRMNLEIARRCWGHELPRPLDREDQRIADLVDECEARAASDPRPRGKGWAYYAPHDATGACPATDAPAITDAPEIASHAHNVVQLDDHRKPMR